MLMNQLFDEVSQSIGERFKRLRMGLGSLLRVSVKCTRMIDQCLNVPVAAFRAKFQPVVALCVDTA